MTSMKPGALAVLFVAGALALPGRAQQPTSDFADSISSIGIASNTGPDGKKVSDVTLSGTLGEISFTLDDKESAILGGSGGPDIAALTRLYVEKSRKKLEATPEEWKLLGPKISLIQRLKGALRSQGRYGVTTGSAADFRKAWKSLSALLKDKQAQADDIKAALLAVNDAQAALTKELRQAQADLKELLTVKQEAILVRNAILE